MKWNKNIEWRSGFYPAACLFLFFFSLLVPTAKAETIALSLPLSGDFAELGKQFQKGAELAMDASGQDHELVVFDDACDPDFGKLAAQEINKLKPAIATGFLCNASAIETATLLSESQIPVLVGGARSVRLIKDRDRESWNLWRFAPGDDYPVQTAAETIFRLWQNTPYAIVDDGTIYGRSFTDQLRLKLDELGLQPQFSDSFRAAQSTQAGLLRRLQRSGITAVFIAATSVEDLTTIAANIKSFEIDLELIATEALTALPFLQEAEQISPGIRVIGWPPAQNRALEDRLAQTGITSDRMLYQGYATIQIALQALSNNPAQMTQRLAEQEFETVFGPARFNSDGSSTFNPYRSLVWNGETLVPENLEAHSQ